MKRPRITPFSCWKQNTKYNWNFNLFRITYDRVYVNAIYGDEIIVGIIFLGFGLAFSKKAKVE